MLKKSKIVLNRPFVIHDNQKTKDMSEGKKWVTGKFKEKTVLKKILEINATDLKIQGFILTS